MADSGRWFKMWCSAVGDPDYANLPIADFGRWAKMGAYIKEHGTDGEIVLSEPSIMICAMMQLTTLKDVILCFEKIKNVNVSTETNPTVTHSIKYENWPKYQGDYSSDRVRKFRAKKGENETPKKRREEKRQRREEKEHLYPLFERVWKIWPNKKSKGQAEITWNKLSPSEQLVETMVSTIEIAKTSKELTKDDGAYIPHFSTWLNAKGWEDEYTPQTEGEK